MWMGTSDNNACMAKDNKGFEQCGTGAELCEKQALFLGLLVSPFFSAEGSMGAAALAASALSRLK